MSGEPDLVNLLIAGINELPAMTTTDASRILAAIALKLAYTSGPDVVCGSYDVEASIASVLKSVA